MNEYISTDIKNIFFLEEIRRICYSDDFNKLYINEVDKVMIVNVIIKYKINRF